MDSVIWRCTVIFKNPITQKITKIESDHITESEAKETLKNHKYKLSTSGIDYLYARVSTLV